MSTEILWNYYKALSEPDKDKNFSINWFYTGMETVRKAGSDEVRESPGFKDWTELNDLTKAFLDDNDAMDSLAAAVPPVEPKYDENANRLNDSQKEAVKLAINNPVTIVQGPPGTGKTQTIINLLICLRNHDQNAKIAMVSTNKDAVQNVEDKINVCDCLKDVYARLGNKTFKADFVKAHPNYKMNDEGLFEADFLNKFPIILSTIHSLRKCIDFDNQFDYVIVDECSQVSTRLGLLAMASAKHLVLFGDDKQLSPIHKYGADRDLTKQVEEIGEYYLDRDDNNFMHACYERFKDKAAWDLTVMLNEHYRCHPNIIDFCNQTFYDGKLIIKTANDNTFPIRIRWYEGNYWERIYQEKDEDKYKDKEKAERDQNDIRYSPNNYNMKQIEIFIEEELPDIIKKFIEARKNNTEYSVCVLSPYKCQIKKLTEKINDRQTLERLSEKIGLTVMALVDLLNDLQNNGADEDDITRKQLSQKKPKNSQQNKGTDKDNSGEVWVFPSWNLSNTIHKAQGKEYDYVCVMPVIDDTSEIWHQSDRITNVAISRAKKELCYIISSSWMPEITQNKLMDSKTKTDMLEAVLGRQKPIFRDPPEYEEQNMGYLPKLVEYVIRNEDKWKGSKYGLKRTDIHSIFDIDPLVSETFGERGDDMSAPERCLCKILSKKIEDDKKNGGPLKNMLLHYDLRLGDDEGKSNIVGMNVDDVDNEHAKEFIKNAHFDFVLTKGDNTKGDNGEIALIIEVDGAQHRGATDFDRRGRDVDFEAYKKRKSNDELKDRLVKTIGEDFYEKRFLRLKTDGTTCDEIKLITDMIEEADKNNVIRPKLNSGRTVISEEFDRREIRQTIISVELRRKLYTLFEDFQKDEITKKFRTTMKTNPKEAIKDLQNSLGGGVDINFNCGSSMDYANPWICRQYMLRYTMAYAFEYYVMYLIALSQLDEPTARAYSFGCGSCLDCLSLAYAKVKSDHDEEAFYRGIDLTDWAENFELKNLPGIDAKKYVDKKGMLAFLEKEPEYMPNILFFPKILSELNVETVKSFCDLMENLKSEELVVCISYRGSKTMSSDLKMSDPIIESLEKKYKRQKLKGLDKIYEIFDLPDSNYKRLSLFNEDNGIFEFEGENEGTKYADIDNRFAVPKDIWEFVGSPGIRGVCAKVKSRADCDLKKAKSLAHCDDCDLKEQCPYSCNVCELKEQCPHSAIANVDNICFQIIYLKKRS